MRITPQKRAIYEMLKASFSHPTAEELYSELQATFPNMSLATVYDNLRKFVALGLCSEVRDSSGATRFDANMHAHHHVVNQTTGEIHDVYLPESVHIPLPEGVDASSIKEIRITYIT